MMIVTNSDILGNNIRNLREKQGMTQQDLADAVEWDVDLLWELEEDISREIDSEILSRICQFFGVDMDRIIREERN